LTLSKSELLHIRPRPWGYGVTRWGWGRRRGCWILVRRGTSTWQYPDGARPVYWVISDCQGHARLGKKSNAPSNLTSVTCHRRASSSAYLAPTTASTFQLPPSPTSVSGPPLGYSGHLPY